MKKKNFTFGRPRLQISYQQHAKVAHVLAAFITPWTTQQKK